MKYFMILGVTLLVGCVSTDITTNCSHIVINSFVKTSAGLNFETSCDNNGAKIELTANATNDNASSVLGGVGSIIGAVIKAVIAF